MKEPRPLPLFRPEAIFHKADALFGDVLLPRSALLNWMVVLAGVLTASLVLLAFFGQYPTRLRATGWISAVPVPPLAPSRGVPDDAAIEVTLLVPLHTVRLLERGMEVRLRFDNLHQGPLHGAVRDISDRTVLPEEQTGPVRLREAAVLVFVEVARKNVLPYGHGYSLRLGTTIYAEVVLERRRIIDLLQAPLHSDTNISRTDRGPTRTASSRGPLES